MMEMVWWQWMLLGIALAIVEIFLPSFVSLWFGLGAIVVGLVAWLFPALPLAWQILLWIIASGLFVLTWFFYFKPGMRDRTKAGIQREALIGEAGRVVRAPVGDGRGVVRFTMPVLGEDEWEFIALQPVAEGDRVVIREFSGNTLVVDKASVE